MYLLEFLLEAKWCYIEEHDSDSAVCFIQRTVGSLKKIYDGVFNSNSKTISKLQWVLKVLVCLLGWANINFSMIFMMCDVWATGLLSLRADGD